MGKKDRFVLAYLKKHGQASATDMNFIEEWAVEIGKAKNAIRHLSNMYKRSKVDRSRYSFGSDWRPGLPKWVYVYQLIE